MKKQLKTKILTSIALFCALCTQGYAQYMVGSALVQDPSRIDLTLKEVKSMSNAKIQSSDYTDTLRLPFFEDFSGVVVPIDSITISTSDNLIKIHNSSLANFPNGTPIFVGFEAPLPLTLSDTLSKKIWYINAIGTNVFTIDSSALLATPMEVFGVNTVVQNAYWRAVKRKYSPTPDTLKWVSNGNAYVNNRFPIDPISFDVATFDGLQADGVPYNTVNVLAKGYSDHLTSLPINTSGLTSTDNVYFSFFWQHNGVGDLPETEDFLELQFKNNTGVWNTIRVIDGNISAMSVFQYEIIQLTDAVYFHEDFQFRIRSYGRLSGPYDIWNVDYIYLDRDRTVLDSRIFDFTIGSASVSFLKNYTAMPYGQYFSNKANEIDGLDFTTNNLDRNLTTNQSLQGQCILTATAGSYSYYFQDVAASHSTGNSTLTYQDVCSLLADSLENQNLPLKVNVTYNLLGSTDTTNILFAQNNTRINYVVLWDYYAYDDGTPEWGVAANQAGAKVANKFTVTLKDTITDIDMYFTRSKGPNMNGRSILVSVWDKNFTLVSQQVAQVRYGGFVRYKLNTPVVVEAGDDFYVGYQQNFVDLLTVGYDKNYNHSDKVFFSLSANNWIAYNQQPAYVEGSMMIRPVLSKNQILVLPVVKEMEQVDPELYPNPANDILLIKGAVTKLDIYSITGVAVKSVSFDGYTTENSVSVADLADGFYIAIVKTKDKTLTKKIIIQH